VAPAPAEYLRIVNHASGHCLAIAGASATNGAKLEVGNCNGGDFQRWNYDAKSGLIRSQRDPRYCVDNGGQFANGASLMLWTCNGNANQRFTLNTSDGTIRMRSYPVQVVDAFGTTSGAAVGTWSFWGGDNQGWSLVP
jgi:hypothetical protein